MVLLALFSLAVPDSGRAYHVTVAGAESLYVTELGAGTPVVLIPGLFGAAYGFRHVMPLLAEHGYRAIVVEPLGIGNSARPRKADYSQSAQAARIANVMKQLGIEHAIVLGHSAGASIALRLARQSPALVELVVDIDAGAVDGASTPGVRRYAAFAPWIKWFGGVKLVRRKIRSSLIESAGDTTWINDEVIAGYTAGAGTDLDATLLSFMAMAKAKEPEKLRSRLSEIQAPVFLLVGGAKHAAGIHVEDVDLFQQSLKAFRADTVPGAGHYIQEEQPAAVADAVRKADQWVRGLREHCTRVCEVATPHP